MPRSLGQDEAVFLHMGSNALTGIGGIALWLGPLLGALAAAAGLAFGHGAELATVGFVATVCVVWWVFEPIPIPVTSLLPLTIFPLMGVLSPDEVAQAYGSPLILLLLGGFLLSKAMEHSGSASPPGVQHVEIGRSEQRSQGGDGFYGSISPGQYVDIQCRDHVDVVTGCSCGTRWGRR
jgi:hypothetical protein